MIYSVLSTFSKGLSDYLCLSYKLVDEVVVLGVPGGENKNFSTNKIIVSLVNIERETASGIQFNYKNVSEKQFKKTLPVWQLNLYVLIAAVFMEKQYEEGLRLLSGAMLYIQGNSTFTLPETGVMLAVEPVNLSFSELSNLWSVCGGTYCPSVLCKIRVLNMDTDNIKQITRAIEKNDVGV